MIDLQKYSGASPVIGRTLTGAEPTGSARREFVVYTQADADLLTDAPKLLAAARMLRISLAALVEEADEAEHDCARYDCDEGTCPLCCAKAALAEVRG